MRKFLKILTVFTLVSITGLQTSACTDDSKYTEFQSDVSETTANNSAFFGFLGSKDDDMSNGLQNTIDTALKPKSNGGASDWDNWLAQRQSELGDKGLSTIKLRYFQGDYHQDKPSNVIDSFWNDKSISWQKNIFNYVYGATKNNEQYHSPAGVDAVTSIVTQKDGNNNDMFSAVPIVFIIFKGHLITAGQSWLAPSSTYPQQFGALSDFMLKNIWQ